MGCVQSRRRDGAKSSQPQLQQKQQPRQNEERSFKAQVFECRHGFKCTCAQCCSSIETKDSSDHIYLGCPQQDDSDDEAHNRWLLDPTAPNGKCTKKVRFDSRVTQKYDVLSMIGKGSFSIVMKVRNKETNEYHSMKVISSGLSMIQNELSILSRVKHKYVVQLVEVFCTSSRVYVILELASGGELYDRITKKGTFAENEAAHTICMLLHGVSYLHSVGVTHRDLKPENLLYSSLDKNAKILITDFGLAHLQKPGEEDQMTEPCGTPEYIAPEILTRLPYTNKVDMWAVGVITYILLSGVMPFDDENRTALYRQILKGRYYFYPEFWSNVSDEAMQFVSTLLCVDADQRPTPEKALTHHWFIRALGQTRDVDRRVGVAVRKSQSLSQYHPRTRSTRSIRSIARSDATRKINRDDVEKLHRDPEVLMILNTRRKATITTNYGVV